MIFALIPELLITAELEGMQCPSVLNKVVVMKELTTGNFGVMMFDIMPEIMCPCSGTPDQLLQYIAEHAKQ